MRTIETGTDELVGRLEERVAVVTLNRPESRNALSVSLKEALHRIVEWVETDDGVGCLLLTGAGGSFCSGGDTKVMANAGRPASMEDRRG
mgnify:CR=1 FL=1